MWGDDSDGLFRWFPYVCSKLMYDSHSVYPRRSGTDRYLSSAVEPRIADDTYEHALGEECRDPLHGCFYGGTGWCQTSRVEVRGPVMRTMGSNTIRSIREHHLLYCGPCMVTAGRNWSTVSLKISVQKVIPPHLTKSGFAAFNCIRVPRLPSVLSVSLQ